MAPLGMLLEKSYSQVRVKELINLCWYQMKDGEFKPETQLLPSIAFGRHQLFSPIFEC